MRFELQRADFWKRISALLFDMIALGVVMVIAAIAMSWVLRFDDCDTYVTETKNEYAQQYGISLDITAEEYEEFSPEVKQKYNDCLDALNKNAKFLAAYQLRNMCIVAIPSFSILLGYIVTELIVPIFFKNGQTLGKKAFGLGVIHTNGVRLKGQAHFIRTIIGKCFIETLVPLLFIYGSLGELRIGGQVINWGAAGLIMVVLMLILELYSVITTKTRSTIHDLISDTVVVDLASQMVFETHDDLVAYKTKLHEEMVNSKEY